MEYIQRCELMQEIKFKWLSDEEKLNSIFEGKMFMG